MHLCEVNTTRLFIRAIYTVYLMLFLQIAAAAAACCGFSLHLFCACNSCRQWLCIGILYYFASIAAFNFVCHVHSFRHCIPCAISFHSLHLWASGAHTTSIHTNENERASEWVRNGVTLVNCISTIHVQRITSHRIALHTSIYVFYVSVFSRSLFLYLSLVKIANYCCGCSSSSSN